MAGEVEAQYHPPPCASSAKLEIGPARIIWRMPEGYDSRLIIKVDHRACAGADNHVAGTAAAIFCSTNS